jgi:hypothetical protein
MSNARCTYCPSQLDKLKLRLRLKVVIESGDGVLKSKSEQSLVLR